MKILEFNGDEFLLILFPYWDKIELELLNGIDVLCWVFSLFIFSLCIPDGSMVSRWLYCPFWLLNGLYGFEIVWDEWELGVVGACMGIDIMGKPFWFDNEDEDADEEVDEVNGLVVSVILFAWLREGDDWFDWVVMVGILDRRFNIELLFTMLLLLRLLVFEIEGFVLLKLDDSFLWWKCVGEEEDIGEVICWDTMRLVELFNCCSRSLWLESLERASNKNETISKFFVWKISRFNLDK